MIPKDFSEYFAAINYLQQQKIIEELLMLTMQNENLPEQAEIEILKCPHCRSRAVRGNGKLKGMQRYVCKDCGKNFSLSTGRFWFALKKRELLSRYLHCLLSGFSIRKSAALTGISIQTSFDWRHKLLTSFKTVLPDAFRGIVEMYDLFFIYSEKGKRSSDKPQSKIASSNGESEKLVAVIATCDRSGTEDLRVITKGCLKDEDISKVLNGRIRKAEVLVKDNLQPCHLSSDEIKLELKVFAADKRQKKADSTCHIRNVKKMYFSLMDFMSPFHGVATKYLQNYMNWFLMLEKIRYSTNKIQTVAYLALSADRAWFDFKSKNINMYFRT